MSVFWPLLPVATAFSYAWEKTDDPPAGLPEQVLQEIDSVSFTVNGTLRLSFEVMIGAHMF